MSVKIQALFYSMYGHLCRMAKAVVEGARSAFRHVPIAAPGQLDEADAILFGTPTRFGNVCAQMRSFLDQIGQIWRRGALVGRLSSVFKSAATQHGGQETTVSSFQRILPHQGMLTVGIPYSEARLPNMAEITGRSPYGAGTLPGGDGKRVPSENEFAIARFKNRHVTHIAKQLAGG